MSIDDEIAGSEINVRRARQMARWAPLVAGLILTTGIVFPWVGHGWLLLLDWVHGPHSGLPPNWGLSAAGQASLPIAIVFNAVAGVVGYATVSWLAIAGSLLLGAWTAGRAIPSPSADQTGLADAGGRVVAAVFFVANPFVFERVATGQVFVILGYSLLPLVLQGLIISSEQSGWRRWSGAAWIAIDGAISVHYLWIGAVLAIAVAVRRSNLHALLWLACTAVGVVLLDAYLALPDATQTSPVGVGLNDLAAFRTAADPHFGLLVNVAGLYGFWRIGPALPKNAVTAWPILLAVLLFVAAWGAWTSLREKVSRDLTSVLIIGAVISFFLAMGNQGITGPAFMFLYHHAPGFAVMREPEKFSSVLAMAYAILIGLGVRSLATARPASQVLARTAVAVAAVFAYTPTVFDGLNGQVVLHHYPADWVKADRLMGGGLGKILVFPSHQYIGFPFTRNEVIANPAPDVFARPALVGGQVEAGPLQSDSTSPEDAFLAELVANGSSYSDLGHLVAQLGVRYVVLFKAGDYTNYGWLGDQTDIHMVMDSRSLTVYRNDYALPSGTRLTTSLGLPSVPCYFQLSQAVDISGIAVHLDKDASCPSAAAQVGSPAFGVRKLSSHSFLVAPGPSGTAVIPEVADGSWQAGSGKGETLINGVQGFKVGPGRETISFRRAWASYVGDAISILLIVTFGFGSFLTWKPTSRERPPFHTRRWSSSRETRV